MIKRAINPSGPIGVDVGSRWIKAVQMGRGAGGARVPARCAAWPRLESGSITFAEACRIREVLEARGFSGKRVVLGAPEGPGCTTDLELPGASSEEARCSVAVMEACRRMKLPPGTFELALWELPKLARATESITATAFVLTHENAAEILDPIEAAGLEVVRIGIASSSVAGLAAAHGSERLDLYVDVGASGARIWVASGQRVVYHRRLEEFGLARLLEWGAERTQEGPREAELAVDVTGRDTPGAKEITMGIIAEAAVSAEYAWHRYPDREPGHVYALGGGAWLVDADAIAGEIGLAGAASWPPEIPQVGEAWKGQPGHASMFVAAAALAGGRA